MDESIKESLVTFRTSQGVEVRGIVQRLNRHNLVFEVYTPGIVFQNSEVLTEFRVMINDLPAYSGKAVIRDMVNTGVTLVCEVTLGESWIDLDFLAVAQAERMRDEFTKFIGAWQKVYKIDSGFKLVVADLHSFLSDLRVWLEQVELAIRSSPSADRLKLERDLVGELGDSVVPSMDELFDRYEEAMDEVDPPMLGAHRAYAKRLLHPLLLCSPFVYRAYDKPLGYAGDYEMVNMIMRQPYEGSTLFAKIINYWFLRQAPAVAHRNRVEHLVQRLTEEAARVTAGGGVVRIWNLGCGPAFEVQRFMQRQPVSDRCRFTLLDFNAETLRHAQGALEQVKTDCNRNTSITLVKKSVNQLLKDAGKPVSPSPENQFDLVYCAGLFDYLSDAVCKRLVNVLYGKVAPGGLLLGTNVDLCNPRQHTMESVLEWNLIYRDHRTTGALVPERVEGGATVVRADDTGANLYVEIRKNHGG